MNFQAAVFVNLSLVFWGAFLGCLSCIVCAKAFKKKCFNFRLSLCFLLLSAAIAFAVLFVVNEKAASADSLKNFFAQNSFVAALYFALGFFCAASLRLFFPIAALLYIAWTLAFGFFLYKKTPLPQKYTITVSESFVRDEESGQEWKFQPQSGGVFLDFAVCELDKNALFPLPRFWHSLSGARASSEKSAPGEFFFQQAASGPAYEKIFSAAARKIFGPPRVYSLEIPKQALYPVIFEVRVKPANGEFSAKLEKIM